MIIPAYPRKSAEHICQMRAKRSAIGVQLINHNVFQIGKNKIKPILAMIWQKRSIYHFRVCQYDVGTLPDSRSLCDRRISGVYTRCNAVFSKIFQEIKTNISLQVLCVTLQGNNTRQISKETMISDSFDND